MFEGRIYGGFSGQEVLLVTFPQKENETDFQQQQTMVTRHSHTIAEHGQTWLAIKNHDTMVKLLPG